MGVGRFRLSVDPNEAAKSRWATGVIELCLAARRFPGHPICGPTFADSDALTLEALCCAQDEIDAVRSTLTVEAQARG